MVIYFYLDSTLWLPSFAFLKLQRTSKILNAAKKKKDSKILPQSWHIFFSFKVPFSDGRNSLFAKLFDGLR